MLGVIKRKSERPKKKMKAKELMGEGWGGLDGGRGRSHKVGPAAKVGPCPFVVVHNGTSNFSLLVLSNVPESTNERYQNTSKAISKT